MEDELRELESVREYRCWAKLSGWLVNQTINKNEIVSLYSYS